MASITIKDVARQAGVGLGTVSRVLNNHPRVSADTRERVLTAISDLGFKPNATARRLPRKTELSYLGVITHPFLKNYHSIAERLRGVQIAILESGRPMELALFSVSSPAHYDSQLQHIVQSSAVDGLLIIDLDLSAEQQEMLQLSQIPFVGINHFQDRLWTCIGTDNELGGYVATRHLIDLGHRRIAYIGDNLFDTFGFPTSQGRYAGYTQALTEARIHLSSRYVKLGEHSYDAAYHLTHDLLQLAQPPSAVFAMSDLQAAGAMAALRDAGLNVPNDVSVVGYDDTELALATGLTTVRQHLETSGKLGVKLLLALIDGHTDQAALKMPPVDIVRRRTTAAPRKLPRL